MGPFTKTLLKVWSGPVGNPFHDAGKAPSVKLARIETFVADEVGVVRAESKAGTVGFGQFPPRDPDLLATICHRHVVPHAFDRDIEDRAALNADVLERRRDTAGYVSRALAGLDTAIWDILGKDRGEPVWKLAGGSSPSVPAYASSMRRETEPEEEAERLADLCEEQGFAAVKLRIGKSGAIGTDEDQWPGRTESLIPTAREILADDVDIYVDANSAFSPEGAIEIGEEILAPHDVAMFEEPVPYWDFDATRAVTEGTDVPVGAGEFLNRPSDWQRVLDDRVVDIVQPDICFSVGFTRALDIARRADAAGMTTRPHSPMHSMNLVFSAHLVAAVDSPATDLEYPIDNAWVAERFGRRPGWDREFYKPNPVVTDGTVTLPDDPGWGVRVDPDWLAAADRRESTPA